MHVLACQELELGQRHVGLVLPSEAAVTTVDADCLQHCRLVHSVAGVVMTIDLEALPAPDLLVMVRAFASA